VLIAALGDSCTFGKGVLEADTWPRQLERLLHAQGADRCTAVLNFGVNGYAARDYLEIFRQRALPLRPRVVVVGFNLNDFPNAIEAVDKAVYIQRGLRRFLPQGLRDGLSRLACYRWLRAGYYERNRERDWKNAEAIAKDVAKLDERPGLWEQQEQYLREIVAGARGAGGEAIVLLFPYESQVHLDAYDRTPIERLAAISERLGVPFVDLASRFRETRGPLLARRSLSSDASRICHRRGGGAGGDPRAALARGAALSPAPQ
jgi:lysophospholipase L1-like esterase